MMRRGTLIALFLVLSLALIETAAAVDVSGRPDIEVVVSDNRVTPGESAELEVFLNNAGRLFRGGPADAEERVVTARGLTLEVLEGDAPVEVRTGVRAVGSVPEGVTGPVGFDVVVREDARPGTYRLPVRMEYRYTSVVEGADTDSPDYRSFSREVTEYVILVVEDEARFQVVDVESGVRVGDSGELRLRVRNVGSEAARDARVTVSSSSPEVRFGNASSAQRFVGRWSEGETMEVRFTARVSRDASTAGLPVSVVVDYTDADGDPRSSEETVTSLRARVERSFSFSEDARLHAGEEGTFAGTVTNTGAETANDSRVVLLGSVLTPRVREHGVGDLPPNESGRWSFTVRALNASGTVVAPLAMEYRDSTGALRRSDVQDVSVAVVGSRAFEFEAVNASFEAGETGTLDLRLTNKLEYAVTDVKVTLRLEEPLSSEDSRAFVQRLEPNESTQVRFELEVGGDAVQKLHPATVDLRYRTPEGEARNSQRYSVAVEVVEEGTSLPLLPLALVLVVLAAAYAWWWFRT